MEQYCGICQHIYPWSPYTDPLETLQKYAKKAREVDLVVMDCIGYTKEHRKNSKYSGKSVLLPRILAIATALSFITSTEK
ncbi:MAG: hypothetical protein DRN04_10505 [Thermoprotei archaeon]|nr:MAG: hypothetical protein DRN04_10505 [Thermoprotei archaeon]